MASEPESLILQILRDMRTEIGDARAEQKNDIAALRGEIAALREELKSDLHSLRADVASDFLVTRREHGEQIVGLRRAVVEYHTSVIGHGILISELEGRVRRIEQHLDLAGG